MGQFESYMEISPKELIDDKSSEDPVELVNQVKDETVQKERV